jgi:hypothetical protein
MLAVECQTNSTSSEMALTLAIGPLFARAISILTPLFVAYGIVEQLGLTIETAKYPVQRLLENSADPSTLSERLVMARISVIEQQIRLQVSARQYETVRDSILRRLAASKRCHDVYISGKTYLLPLAYLQLKRAAHLNEAMDRVKVRLAQHSDLSLARGLRRAILGATSAIPDNQRRNRRPTNTKSS